MFLFSLFGTNMTAFAILGSSGHAFNNGIVTFGLMASSSALIIPLSLFLIGTRVWALGKRYGFMTPVQMFRDRWECGHIGTVIFAVQAALLVPYIIIGVMGGGTTLNAISGGRVPYWLGGAIVALVVMSYVFFGGMRGTAWVNTFQTMLFLCFGAVAVIVIGVGMGGFSSAIEALQSSPATAPLLTRERISPLYLLQLHVHPALVDRVSAHRHLLPDRAQDGSVQEDRRALPALHARDLAAVRVSRRDGQPRERRSADQAEDRSARRARHRGSRHDAGRARRACAQKTAGDDVIVAAARALRSAVAGGFVGRGRSWPR